MALDANDSLLRYDAPEKELYEIGVQQVSGSNSVVHVVY